MDTFLIEFDAGSVTADLQKLPRLVGPFYAKKDASDWAKENCPNGSWIIAPIHDPEEQG